MRNKIIAITVLAGLLSVEGVRAQPANERADRWRAQMQAAKEADYALVMLRPALETAESFGESDLRLFETVVRLAVACNDDDDCDLTKAGYLDRALRMRSRVEAQKDSYAELLVALGKVASGLARYADALAVDNEALAFRQKTLGADDQKVAETLVAIAWVYHGQKNSALARTYMQRALNLREKAGAAKTEGFANLLGDSAELYLRNQDRTRGRGEYAQATTIRGALWPQTDVRYIAALKQIANKTRWGEDQDLAEQTLRTVVTLETQAHTNRSEEYFRALRDLAYFLRYRHRLEEAQAVFALALGAKERMGKKDLEAAEAMEQMSKIARDRGLYSQAAELAERALALRVPLGSTSDYGTASLYALLAEAYLRDRNQTKSEEYFTLLSTAQYKGVIINSADTLAKIYLEREDRPHAAEKLETLVAVMEAGDANDPRLLTELPRLAQLYASMGRNDDANRMNMQTLRIAGSTIRNSVILTALALSPILVLVVGGGGFWWFARRLNRKLAVVEGSPVPVAAAQGVVAELPEMEGPRPIVTSTEEVSVASVEPPPLEWLFKAPMFTPQPEEPPPLPPMAPPPLPSSRISLHADGSELFAMRVLNLLLSLLTVGIYSFWGKAKVRRYVCGQAEYLGDRFAFHGTGRELLLGWLRSLPALACVFLVPNVLPVFWQHKYSLVAGQFVAIGALVILWPVARIGAYRYRLNRMSWRGIRFSYRGKAIPYLGLSLLGYLITGLTLGIYAPFLQTRLRKALYNKTYFGDGLFEFSGRGRDLLPAWLFALPLTIFTFGLGWVWWSALRQRYFWAHTTFAGSRFRCTATAPQLLGLWIVNFLIIIPTVGLGMSWVMLRTLRFWTEHLEIVQTPDLTGFRQEARATSAMGESFADFLGFDFGF